MNELVHRKGVGAASHRTRWSRWAAVAVALSLGAACGSSDPEALPVTTQPVTTQPVTTQPGPTQPGPTTTVAGAGAVTASPECIAAFNQGSRDERAGTETFVAYRPSVQTCASLAEWTAALFQHGHGLDGQEAVFVDRTCSFADDATKALPICQSVKGSDG